jgi:hypothetical protein
MCDIWGFGWNALKSPLRARSDGELTLAFYLVQKIGQVRCDSRITCESLFTTDNGKTRRGRRAAQSRMPTAVVPQKVSYGAVSKTTRDCISFL